jgi:ATP-dependent protease HslVU (ClpYQ) peptidase subunit
MTAEIGIMNKTAIVLAGDSAVTIGDGKKVYNTANKIFQLCSRGTVGIMVYNNANWMGIPLETIIKSYSNEFGNSTLPNLEDYKKSFIDFLKSKFYKYVTPKAKEKLLLIYFKTK